MFAILINALNKDDTIKKYKLYKTLFLIYTMILGIVILILKQIYDQFSI